MEKVRESKIACQNKAFVLLVDSSVLRSSEDDGRLFFVQSQTNSDKVYEVVHYGHKFGCSCPDFLCRQNIESCKHIYAVKLFMESEEEEGEAK
jgi:hypothetical protein